MRGWDSVPSPGTWRLSYTEAPAPNRGAGWFDHAHADLAVSSQVRAEVTRATGVVKLRSATPLPPNGLVHPYLAQPASVLNWWLDRDPVHAGAVVCDGKAWGVLGVRGRGKSSLVAQLWRGGLTVLSDDLLIVDEIDDRIVAFAGPRCIDLRPDAARLFPEGCDVGVLGTRRRWRVPIGQAPCSVPLAGWITLGWAPRPSVERVPLHDRIGVWESARGPGLPITSASRLLALATRPILRFNRPRDWAQAARGCDVLMAALTEERCLGQYLPVVDHCSNLVATFALLRETHTGHLVPSNPSWL